jgi:hypothetical protein
MKLADSIFIILITLVVALVFWFWMALVMSLYVGWTGYVCY